MDSLGFFVIMTFLSTISGSNVTSRMYGVRYEEYDPYPVTAIEHEFADGYYTRVRPEKGLDLTNLGTLAILKLLFLKLKGLGFGFILLLKIPLLMFLLMGKFMMIMKVFKVIKFFTMPLMFLSLLPMLLGPLLLLAPLLLPLLLALPIPVLTAATTTAAPTTGRKKRSEDTLLEKIAESEECMERITCHLQKSTNYKNLLNWLTKNQYGDLSQKILFILKTLKNFFK